MDRRDMDNRLSTPFKRRPYVRMTVPAPMGLLVGIISGDEVRRRFHRHVLSGWTARVLFVVGRNQPDAHRPDVLNVDVDEHVGRLGRLANRTTTGSLSSSVKLFFFLRVAAEAPEPMVARMDDDTHVVPAMVDAYAAAMRGRTNVYAGVFEFYNYIPSRLKSTGHGVHPGNAWIEGRRLHNCSTLTNAICRGPFAFAKGPLLFMSRPLVARLVHATSFAKLTARTRTRPHNRVDDDVQLGYLLAELPDVQYVRVPRTSLLLAPTAAPKRRTFLAAHRYPFECYRPYAAADHSFSYRQACLPNDKKMCTQCLHQLSHRVCMLEVVMDDMNGSVDACEHRFSPVLTRTRRPPCHGRPSSWCTAA